ncbi:alpha/beta hydrolase family protein [Lutimonas zeaxanthinifaciens]|uniref:alpha/beta hydrolase family protein n=1 Tax=Lutimonas zeaxanthinifaciens TaxID=3060215 RepID=UPI00265CB756|nr:alpha/beta hydrolase [Lutimonas sp. YSD2104]WKK65163.1 alpha/beta hydrolase [Lutimonas sp. YSD2104]
MTGRKIKRILKILSGIFAVLLITFYFLVNYFINPKSDEKIRDTFADVNMEPVLRYLDFKGEQVRRIQMKPSFDSLLPTLVFVHGSPGSFMDFKRYLSDSTLNKKANMIAYDRIGYGVNNKGRVLKNLEEEIAVLDKVLTGINLSNVILIGYSYGGTLVMAADKNYRAKIALAPSVRGDLEPMFWLMNLTRWKLSKPFIPKVFLAASSEKFRHVEELPEFDNRWNRSLSKVMAIHGEKDRIVPFENSVYLKEIFEKKKFSLIPIKEGNHSLIWTNFDLIREEVIKSLED